MIGISQIFRPGLSYWQYLLRVGGHSQPYFGIITNSAAMIFIPISMLSGNWLLFCFCILYIILSFYWYHLEKRQSIELTNSHLIYTSYNFLGYPIKFEIPYNEILNIVYLQLNHGFFHIYKMSINRSLDKNEPLLFRKRTESITMTYWDNHVVEKMEQELKMRLPRVSFEEPLT